MILLKLDFTLPIEDPVLRFLLLLIIILGAPLLLNKIKVPHLIGLIIAGAAIGPNGFNILSRDSSIVVIGTTGLLYIMFLAGLEIDINDFKKNKWKSLSFGLYTFITPMILGYLGGRYLLGFNGLTSILFASIFSSHTLIAYPLVSKLGIAKNRAVNVTVGGTMITDLLALLVLAVIVGMVQGEVGSAFWIQLTVSVLVFGAIVLFVFPIIGRWFFKRVDDRISQYIFVLVMIYLAALLAEIAGVEAIIGAFLAGLALNRLIPHTSSLMNRVEFVGNAFFIPFFLISVGMLIDFKVFFKSTETLKVAAIMVGVEIFAKYVAAKATQKTFGYKKEEGGLIFGLSVASAAATLAVVMVGYNIILSENELGEPVRLLNEHVLNGSIILILITCTVSSFSTMANARKLAQAKNEETVAGKSPEKERILITLSHHDIVEKLVNLAMMIKAKTNTDRIFALNIINEDKNESSEKDAEKVLTEAEQIASATDIVLHPLKRYDNDVVAGINNVIKEKEITDLIVGVKPEKGLSPSFIYNLHNSYLQNKFTNLLIYHPVQPIATIREHMVFIPPDMETEPGFFYALFRVWNTANASGSLMNFYASEETIELLKRISKKTSIEATYHTIKSWKDVEDGVKQLKDDSGLIGFMAKRGMPSYIPQMKYVPDMLNAHFKNKNYLLIFPYTHDNDLTDVRSISSNRDFVAISKIVEKVFK